MGTHHNECLCSNKRHYEKNILTQRQLSLAECASLEAQGDMVRLDAALSKALDNGVSVNELKEAFSQLYAYTGFPRSLNALNRLKNVLDDRKHKGICDNEGKPWTKPALWNDASEALKEAQKYSHVLWVDGNTSMISVLKKTIT